MRVLGEHAAERARPRLAVEQAEDVAGHLIEPHAAGKLCFHIWHEAVEHIEPRGRGLAFTEQAPIHLGENVGILIGSAPEHHAIDMREMLGSASPNDPMPPLTMMVRSGRRALMR